MNFFKRVAIIASSILLLSTTASFAAIYNSSDGKVSVTDADRTGVEDSASNMYTVLIVNADKVKNLDELTDDDILYVDQVSDSLTAFTGFGVKLQAEETSLAEGTYAMYIGSDNLEAPSVEYFYVKDISDPTSKPSIGLGYKTKLTDNNVYIAEITNFSDDCNYGLYFSYNFGGKTCGKYYKLDNVALKALAEMNITGEATKGFGVITSGTEKLENFTVIPYIIEESVQTNTTNSDSDTTQSADNTETEAN